KAGIYIPNMCYHPELPPLGACRLCLVEIENVPGYHPACTTTAENGMIVQTNTPKLQKLRKDILWLILSEYHGEPEEDSHLKKVIDYVGVSDPLPGFKRQPKKFAEIIDEPLFTRDPNLCILCERCVRMCQEVRGVGAIGLIGRGINTYVGTAYGRSLEDSACRFCEACVEVCPSGSLKDKKKFTGAEREEALLPCSNTCPAGIDIPRYVRLIAQGRVQDALEVIRETVPFPHVLGCVCHHPCEEVCRRCELNDPIAIRALKRFVAENDSGRWRSKIEVAPDSGKQVAIVGSGPAGLTAAWFLRKLGHAVTVFEARPVTGGMMRTGIPAYRLPRDILDREIEDIANIGVEIKTNTEMESLDALFDRGFHSIFLAIGAQRGMTMGIHGEEDDPRILDGVSVLKSINLGKKVDLGKDVAVVGGGNVAIDVARCARRIGASKVTILYRRTRNEMPANDEEIDEALAEGVDISYLVVPQRALPGGSRLALECIRMKLGKPDASGRARPIPIEGSEFTIEVDRLIAAIGQRSDVPPCFAVDMNKKGCIEAKEGTLLSSRDGVFAGGDIVTGPASVIEAIQAGRTVAASIDRYLGGKGKIDQRFIPADKDFSCLGREESFAYKPRVKRTVLPANVRLRSFVQEEESLTAEAAMEEAGRCLQCQLRLAIYHPPLPHELPTRDESKLRPARGTTAPL
ncbi:MAG: FAD-dependent oxidoreductase, partial [Chloroflexota bacterium]|nr:FAD-dependent oxidoreductase [Chloroflexota bacterium]